MAEGIVSLREKRKEWSEQERGGDRGVTYSIRDESSSLDTSRLDCLEEVHHTLCLQSLQLRVEADECPTATNSITVADTHTHTHTHTASGNCLSTGGDSVV